MSIGPCSFSLRPFTPEFVPGSPELFRILSDLRWRTVSPHHPRSQASWPSRGWCAGSYTRTAWLCRFISTIWTSSAFSYRCLLGKAYHRCLKTAGTASESTSVLLLSFAASSPPYRPNLWGFEFGTEALTSAAIRFLFECVASCPIETSGTEESLRIWRKSIRYWRLLVARFGKERCKRANGFGKRNRFCGRFVG